MLTVEKDGVIYSECYGPMSTESGGSVTLESFIAHPDNKWVREQIGDKAFEEALAYARELVAAK